MNDPTPVLTGINHVALITGDLDRFVAFYTDVFGVEVVLDETTPQGRHALLRVAGNSVLHAFEHPDNPHAVGLPELGDRGHLDHFALTVADAEAFELVRARLLAREATTGTVVDYGPAHSLYFDDPDGMACELVLVLDADLRGMHGPQLVAPAP